MCVIILCVCVCVCVHVYMVYCVHTVCVPVNSRPAGAPDVLAPVGLSALNLQRLGEPRFSSPGPHPHTGRARLHPCVLPVHLPAPQSLCALIQPLKCNCTHCLSPVLAFHTFFFFSGVGRVGEFLCINCSVVAQILDLNPQGRWFDPWSRHDKICTAVGPLSKALYPHIAPGGVSPA